MAEQFSTSGGTRSGGSGKLVAIGVGVGLLVGAGIVTPFALNYRSTMQQAQLAAVDHAARAEQNKNEAIALEKQKGELRDNLGQAEKTITTLREDLTTRSTALDALRLTDENMTKEVEALRADIQKKAAAMTELDGRVKDARSEVETATKENADLVGKVNALRVEVSRITETIQTQGVEIARLSEAVKQEEAAKTVALQQAAQQQQRAEVAETTVVKTTTDLMALAPVRIEERRSTKTGRKIGEKSGVPFAAVFDPIGDAFTGIGERLFGKSGPVELVAVYKDGREQTVTTNDADKWKERGIRVVKLRQKA